MITFFSNFINEHQIPFCNAMYQKTNGEFRFVATEPIWQERLDMGFEDQSDNFPYVVKSFVSDETYREALRLGYDSDVVIIGSAPDVFIEKRLADNKLTFRYCERFFKEGRWRILDPRVLRARYMGDTRYSNINLHMLCASAYTAPDCRFIHAYPNKTYKWGYFPAVKEYEDIQQLITSKKKNSILWAGRLIDWKHPEEVVFLAEKLAEEGIDFDLTIIGTGIIETQIADLIKKKDLQSSVHMIGSMSPERVREYMERSEIYLFTSDHQEGWGAVLNESMNSACAVVACREIGSVPYLIEDGVNGFIYDKRGKNTLYSHVKQLIEDKSLRERIQKNAYDTMKNVWNAESATDRLLYLIDCIQKGTETGYTSGPCSRD